MSLTIVLELSNWNPISRFFRNCISLVIGLSNNQKALEIEQVLQNKQISSDAHFGDSQTIIDQSYYTRASGVCLGKSIT